MTAPAGQIPQHIREDLNNALDASLATIHEAIDTQGYTPEQLFSAIITEMRSLPTDESFALAAWAIIKLVTRDNPDWA